MLFTKNILIFYIHDNDIVGSGYLTYNFVQLQNAQKAVKLKANLELHVPKSNRHCINKV